MRKRISLKTLIVAVVVICSGVGLVCRCREKGTNQFVTDIRNSSTRATSHFERPLIMQVGPAYTSNLHRWISFESWESLTSKYYRQPNVINRILANDQQPVVSVGFEKPTFSEPRVSRLMNSSACKSVQRVEFVSADLSQVKCFVRKWDSVKKLVFVDCEISWSWLQEISNMSGIESVCFVDMHFDPKFLKGCLLYTSPSPRDGLLSRMPSSA